MLSAHIIVVINFWKLTLDSKNHTYVGVCCVKQLVIISIILTSIHYIIYMLILGLPLLYKNKNENNLNPLTFLYLKYVCESSLLPKVCEIFRITWFINITNENIATSTVLGKGDYWTDIAVDCDKGPLSVFNFLISNLPIAVLSYSWIIGYINSKPLEQQKY